ncbi:MAG TPA: family 1 encapsulin nanocompartment shell protein, partial [Polyangiaceae bacterium]|nr:family 1 encapsulin nanocompartment shell protein [Polyangiaceae bacterium]
MDDLLRELAPISKEAWAAIDDEAKKHLTVSLGGRRIVDFKGPLGWGFSAVELGRVRATAEPPRAGVAAVLREVQPLVELRAPFELSRSEIADIARGSSAPDLEPVRRAARAIALAEDGAIFHGYAAANITGIFEASAANSLTLSREYQKYPLVVSEALARLHENGVGGGYAIALGPDCFKGLTGTASSGGYPVLEHVQRLIAGPVFWAPGVRGALVASLRGG